MGLVRRNLHCCGKVVMRSSRLAGPNGIVWPPWHNIPPIHYSCCKTCKDDIIVEFIAIVIIAKRLKCKLPRGVRNSLLGYLV